VTTTDLKVSVIIPAYTIERWELLQQAVASACNQTLPPAEVIVPIDNNEELVRIGQSKWPTTRTGTGVPVRVIASEFSHDERDLSPHVRAHGAKRRFGAGQARNIAAEHAVGKILAFLDDDAMAETNWIEELLKPYSDPPVLAVGGAPYPRYEAQRPLWFPPQFDWVFGCAYEGLPTTTSPFPRLIGANMSVRADALKQVGGFHSIDFDDMDMCHRVAALGGPAGVVFAPSAIVRHYVPVHRTSWSYFWRRCFYVNREKVRAHREMGAASSFGPDVAFVARTMTVGITHELRSVFRGDGYAILRMGAILVGVTSAAVGNIVGRARVAQQKLCASTPPGVMRGSRKSGVPTWLTIMDSWRDRPAGLRVRGFW
jgi:glucosyl-dolichyl phosphate glucuronosyltransferase